MLPPTILPGDEAQGAERNSRRELCRVESECQRDGGIESRPVGFEIHRNRPRANAGQLVRRRLRGDRLFLRQRTRWKLERYHPIVRREHTALAADAYRRA